MNERRKAAEQSIALSLGSNVGAREETILAAVTRLSAESGLTVVSLSSLYETSPIGTDTPATFINAACIATTTLAPRALLAVCQAVELAFGRIREGTASRECPGGPGAVPGRMRPPGDRTLDIDIILYGDLVVDEADLRIPHPRFKERLFVLGPLAEIGSRMRVPPAGSTIRDLYRDCPASGWVRKVSARGHALNLLKTKKLE